MALRCVLIYLFFICVFAVGTEVGVSKVYSWEECGKSPTRVGRQSLRGNPQQDSRFRHQNRVKEAWSKQRLWRSVFQPNPWPLNTTASVENVRILIEHILDCCSYSFYNTLNSKPFAEEFFCETFMAHPGSSSVWSHWRHSCILSWINWLKGYHCRWLDYHSGNSGEAITHSSTPDNDLYCASSCKTTGCTVTCIV